MQEVFFPCWFLQLLLFQVLLSEIFTEHFILWGHFHNVFCELGCFILDNGCDAHCPSAFSSVLSVWPVATGFGMQSTMHGE